MLEKLKSCALPLTTSGLMVFGAWEKAQNDLPERRLPNFMPDSEQHEVLGYQAAVGHYQGSVRRLLDSEGMARVCGANQYTAELITDSERKLIKVSVTESNAEGGVDTTSFVSEFEEKQPHEVWVNGELVSQAFEGESLQYLGKYAHTLGNLVVTERCLKTANRTGEIMASL